MASHPRSAWARPITAQDDARRQLFLREIILMSVCRRARCEGSAELQPGGDEGVRGFIKKKVHYEEDDGGRSAESAQALCVIASLQRGSSEMVTSVSVWSRQRLSQKHSRK